MNLCLHAARAISKWPRVLLLAACGTQGGSPPTTSPETTTATVEPTPVAYSPPEALSSGGPDIIVPPGDDGSLPGDLWVGCRFGPHFQVSDLAKIVPLGEGGVSEAIRSFLSSDEGRHWPQADWLILRETRDEVLVVHQDVDGLAFMSVRSDGGPWMWAGSQGGAPCPLYYRVPEGLHAVDWRLHPEAAPDAAATTLEVLVNEQECVNGQEIGDRLRGPQVVMTERAVRIAFAAEPPPGDAFDCPSNPDSAVTVELPAPLGDREIIEGLAIGIDLEDYLPDAGAQRP